MLGITLKKTPISSAKYTQPVFAQIKESTYETFLIRLTWEVLKIFFPHHIPVPVPYNGPIEKKQSRLRDLTDEATMRTQKFRFISACHDNLLFFPSFGITQWPDKQPSLVKTSLPDTARSAAAHTEYATTNGENFNDVPTKPRVQGTKQISNAQTSDIGGRARRKGKKKLGQEDTGERNDRQGEGVEAVSPAKVYTAHEFNAEFFSKNVRNDAERWLKRQLLSHQRSKLLGTKRTINPKNTLLFTFDFSQVTSTFKYTVCVLQIINLDLSLHSYQSARR
ncbi:hypothetical protein EAG_02140 [Camponotus floridanus]|uniref:Uncharacterized protein n=1 Tax=Camponotus floridanus TaxID=104421 RepID=E2B1S0_CAMFO|nr:hypothetical protein EAG_02140 [Camponotus floridanus]